MFTKAYKVLGLALAQVLITAAFAFDLPLIESNHGKSCFGRHCVWRACCNRGHHKRDKFKALSRSDRSCISRKSLRPRESQETTQSCEDLIDRRSIIQKQSFKLLYSMTLFSVNSSVSASGTITNPMSMRKQKLLTTSGGSIEEIADAESFSGLLYKPGSSNFSSAKKNPLILVLHGAGLNQIPTAWNLANPFGEHAGLPPSLLASGKAPSELSDNFFVASPYAFGKSSLYEEPRSKTLRFLRFVLEQNPQIDPDRVFLFGFSEGATLGVELLTVGWFKGAVIASYGFTGKLPPIAVQRLERVPIWVFHSSDDVIYSVHNSDRLVETLRNANKDLNLVKYTRYDKDPEGFSGAVQGHSTGITASKSPQIYSWMLKI